MYEAFLLAGVRPEHPDLPGFLDQCGAVEVQRQDVPDRAMFDAFLADPVVAKTWPDAGRRYEEFVLFLQQHNVDDVAPPWHLWRQGTDWRMTMQPPFAVPPRDQWAGMVPTLRLLRDRIVPEVGPVEVVSGFRTGLFNELAGGSKGSRHQWFEAVDVIPRYWWAREALHHELLTVWEAQGPLSRAGLGLYGRLRFHIDTWRYRKW